MHHKDQLKRIAAGVFLFSCIALIVFVIFTIGLEKGFTEPKIKIQVLFHKVGGLMLGAPVRLSGVTVGTVSDIDFIDKEIQGRAVKVTLNLYKKYETHLRKISGIVIVTEGVLGEKMIDISVDSSVYREDLTAFIFGGDPIEAQELAEAFQSSADALLETSGQIGVMLKELKELATSTRRLMNRMEQRVIDGNLFKVF
jgi:phospholipid/cholesterol/gamma-HCH transport system substrate-binding protein